MPEDKPARSLVSRPTFSFLMITSGQSVSAMGSALTLFAISWSVWTTYKSGQALGLLWIIIALPYIILGPFAGPYVDRWNRRYTMLGADAFCGVATLIMALVLNATHASLVVVYVLTLLVTTAKTFHGPAFSAVIPLLIPDKHLSRANSLIEFSLGGSQLLAPAIGGILLAGGWSVPFILFIDAFSFFFAALALALARVPGTSAAAEHVTTKGMIIADVVEGAKYLWSNRHLFWLIMLLALINLLGGGLSVLLPQLVTDKFGAGSQLLGIMESAIGVGVLVGSAVLLFWGGPKNRVIGIICGLSIGALFQTIVGLSPMPWMVVIALGLAVTAWIVVSTLQTTLLQQAVVPNIQGRVFAFRRSLEQFTWPVSSFLAGFLSPTFMRADVLLTIGGVLSLGAIAAVTSMLSFQRFGPKRPAYQATPNESNDGMSDCSDCD